MSYTIDANVLLYASDAGSPLHDKARGVVDRIATSSEIVYLFWPTLMAYLRISTHPAIFARPLAAPKALDNVERLIDRANVRSPGEPDSFWRRYVEVAASVSASGNLVSDAHLVALMLEHEVRTIWTRDRDFRKFDGIAVYDPFD